MLRKLKVLGAALVAISAMSAVTSAIASASQFTAVAYPVALTGSQPEGKRHVFTVGGGEVSCNVANFAGTGTAASETQLITPFYGNAGECEAFGLEATVKMNGCKYLFHTSGTADITGCGGNTIEIGDVFGICRITIHETANSHLGPVTYTNNGSHIDITASINNIHATVSGIFCPIPSGTYTNATYTGTITMQGSVSIMIG